MSLIRPIPIDASPDIDAGLGSSIAIPVESMVLRLSPIGAISRATFACEDSPAGDYVATFDLDISAGNVQVRAGDGQTSYVTASGPQTLSLSSSIAISSAQVRGSSNSDATITNLRLEAV